VCQMACPYSDKPYHKNGSCSQCSSDGRLVPSEKAYWELTLGRLGLGPVCEADLDSVNTGENCPVCKSSFHYALRGGRRECGECGTGYRGPNDERAPLTGSNQSEPSAHHFDCLDEIRLSHLVFNRGTARCLDEGDEECE